LERKENSPLVSVIVPAYNSAGSIGKCLDSIKNQTYKNMEIIVVDDGSSDDTVAEASKHGITTVEIKPNRGAPHAMNVGARHAKGEYVFFIDGDAWAPKTLIEKAVNYITDKSGFSAVGGWYIPIGGHKLYGLYLRTVMFNRISHCETQVFEGKSDPQLYGCFLGFTRSVLAEEKFAEDLKAIYDREYLARIASKGYKVLFSKDLFVYHPVPSKLSGVVRSLRVQSMWMGIVGKKLPIIIKYHVLMVSAIILTLLLSIFVSPFIAPIALLAYSLVQAIQFLKVRRRFSIKPKKMLGLISLTFVLTAASLLGFIFGLFKKPSSHWK
jgi:glycosyltransferase involved in cell wall biosynthesis